MKTREHAIIGLVIGIIYSLGAQVSHIGAIVFIVALSCLIDIDHLAVYMYVDFHKALIEIFTLNGKDLFNGLTHLDGHFTWHTITILAGLFVAGFLPAPARVPAYLALGGHWVADFFLARVQFPLRRSKCDGE